MWIDYKLWLHGQCCTKKKTLQNDSVPFPARISQLPSNVAFTQKWGLRNHYCAGTWLNDALWQLLRGGCGESSVWGTKQVPLTIIASPPPAQKPSQTLLVQLWHHRRTQLLSLFAQRPSLSASKHHSIIMFMCFDNDCAFDLLVIYMVALRLEYSARGRGGWQVAPSTKSSGFSHRQIGPL